MKRAIIKDVILEMSFRGQVFRSRPVRNSPAEDFKVAYIAVPVVSIKKPFAPASVSQWRAGRLQLGARALSHPMSSMRHLHCFAGQSAQPSQIPRFSKCSFSFSAAKCQP